MDGFVYAALRERPGLADAAAKWFHEKWGVPKEAYLERMKAYLSGETEYGWYICLYEDRIIGGLGVVENDFHERKDLTPNVCAVYVDEDFRGQGLAGFLLQNVCDDMAALGCDTLYLLTDHAGFYEKYGWEYMFDVRGDDGCLSRMYVHRSDRKKRDAD